MSLALEQPPRLHRCKSRVALDRRKPKGDGGKVTGKKRHDNLRQYAVLVCPAEAYKGALVSCMQHPPLSDRKDMSFQTLLHMSDMSSCCQSPSLSDRKAT